MTSVGGCRRQKIIDESFAKYRIDQKTVAIILDDRLDGGCGFCQSFKRMIWLGVKNRPTLLKFKFCLYHELGHLLDNSSIRVYREEKIVQEKSWVGFFASFFGVRCRVIGVDKSLDIWKEVEHAANRNAINHLLIDDDEWYEGLMAILDRMYQLLNATLINGKDFKIPNNPLTCNEEFGEICIHLKKLGYHVCFDMSQDDDCRIELAILANTNDDTIADGVVLDTILTVGCVNFYTIKNGARELYIDELL